MNTATSRAAALAWSEVLYNVAYAGLCAAVLLMVFPDARYQLQQLARQVVYELRLMRWRARTQPAPAWVPLLQRQHAPELPDEPGWGER